MKILITFFTLFFMGSLAAAPISPMAHYSPSSHGEDELGMFWSSVKKMNEDMKGKDCFKRAHMWSWLLDKRYGVNSIKVFMHYTDKFNRELDDQGRTGLAARLGRIFSSNTGWDFHVAPAVEVNGEFVVLDPQLRDAPETIEQWVDHLTSRGEQLLIKRKNDIMEDIKAARKYVNSRYSDERRKRHYRKKIRELRQDLRALGLSDDPREKVEIKCKEITHIMEFDRAQEEEWCFYQKTSMYYFGPLELRYLNYGNVAQDKRYPITDLRFHTQENYDDGRNYVERYWDHKKLEMSLDEFNFSSRPKSIWHIR